MKYLTTLYLHVWILMWLFKIINNYTELDQKPYKVRIVEWNIKVPYIFIREFTIMMRLCKIINNDHEADQKPCIVREDKRKVSCSKIFSFLNTHFEKLEKYWIDCKSNKSFFIFKHFSSYDMMFISIWNFNNVLIYYRWWNLRLNVPESYLIKKRRYWII